MDWETGLWIKGMSLSGSQADFIHKTVNAIREETIAETAQEVMEMYKPFITALTKIDGMVSTDAGTEADCFIGLNEPRGEEPNPEMAKDWARLIVDIYKITHPLIHECCGRRNTIKYIQSLIKKQFKLDENI